MTTEWVDAPLGMNSSAVKKAVKKEFEGERRSRELLTTTNHQGKVVEIYSKGIKSFEVEVK